MRLFGWFRAFRTDRLFRNRSRKGFGLTVSRGCCGKVKAVVCVGGVLLGRDSFTG
jgi:hypothetical protein